MILQMFVRSPDTLFHCRRGSAALSTFIPEAGRLATFQECSRSLRYQAKRKLQSVRTVWWVCLAAIFLLGGNCGSAQIEPDVLRDSQATGGPLEPGAASSEDGEKLARKYDLNRVGNRGIGGEFNLHSMEAEVKLGKKLSSGMDQRVRGSREPVTTKYLNGLCHALSRQSDSRFPLTVRIIESQEPTIFSLPGGFLYVTTGLFAVVDNEAELAGLISREIGHIAARHATKEATRRTLWKVLSTPVVLLPFGGLVIQIGGVAVPMKLNRDAELEADLLGLQYMYLAGYDPGEFLRFLDRAYSLEDRSPSRVAQMFSDYPSLQERLRRDQMVISTFPPRVEYAVDTSAFAEVKAKFTSPQPALRRGSDSAGPRLRRRMQETRLAGSSE